MSEWAEDLPYWKTSQSSPDTWIDKAKLQIDRAGGTILSEGFGASEGKSAYMLRFEVGGSSYRIVWPIAESKFIEPANFVNHARRQAATMLFHDVKSMCIKARAIGFEVAFFSHMELPNGKVANEMVGAVGGLPKLLESKS